MTESGRIGETDRAQAFDNRSYRVIAVLDAKTCNICREMHNQVFSDRDREPGTTAPPFHGYCRCVTVPVDGDVKNTLEDDTTKRERGIIKAN